MLRFVLLGVAALLFARVCPGPVRAEPAPASAAPSGEPVGYKAAINSALEEFNQGNFEEAREHFARAHALSPNARTLRGLGMSEFELRNYVDAVDRLEQALASEQKALTGELRQQTLALLTRAQAYVGDVQLKLEPPSSGVRADGVPVELGSRQRLRLEVGDHVLEFSAQGYVSERRALKIRGEQAISLQVSLARARAVDVGASLMNEGPSSTKGTPLYKRWWLWTGMGALVVGALTAGVILSTRKAQVGNADGGSTGDTIFVE